MKKGHNSTILNIEQGVNETLREFVKRFTTALQVVDSPSDEVAIRALQSGLKGNNFTTKFAKKLAKTLSEAIERAHWEMNVEEMLDRKFKEATLKARNTSTTKSQ